MKQRWTAILALIIPSHVYAHPHLRVDQQAHLSIGRTQADIVFYLASSTRDGAHMFDHIDTDRNGRLSQTEQKRSAQELVLSATLTVDGKSSRLIATQFGFPERRAMVSGHGVIWVGARAMIRLEPEHVRRLTFNATYRRFSQIWSIQPFYRSDLSRLRPLPIVRRRNGPNAIEIVFRRSE